MKILHIIGTLNPNYGGPVEVLLNLAKAHRNYGHYIEILTLDSRYKINSINNGLIINYIGPSIGKYKYNFKLIPWLKYNVNRFDIIIVHGIWQYQSLAVWITNQIIKFPYLIFVHGALDPWFKRRYPLKHLKKWLYWPWAEYNVLKSAAGVIYTSDDEKYLASQSFCLYKANEIVINIGIYNPSGNPIKQKELFYQNYPLLLGKRLLLFMSRIHPKKGCDILIEAFGRIANNDPNLHLVIAGPDESNWVHILQKQALDLNIADRITWTGMLKDDLKWGAINSADCFVLPSHSENFGIVIVEALACGIPTIITNKVNIWQKIAEEKAGLISSDDVPGLYQSLCTWINLDDSEKTTYRKNAKRCFSKNFDIDKNAQEFIKIIQSELQNKKNYYTDKLQ